MTIYFLPLEPLEMRYTSQWYKWFKECKKFSDEKFIFIDGEQVKSQLNGTQFLDMNSTFIWKFEQLKNLFKKDLKINDTIFIPDGEFPGIEALKYLEKFKDLKLNIVQIWHAGTYDPYDLTYQNGLERYGSKLEEVWMDLADKIFVATDFHKELILTNRNVNEDKIVVTGLPADVNRLNKKYGDKKNRTGMLFTGRKSFEKGYDVIKKIFSNGHDIICSQDFNWHKEYYYKELSKREFVIAPSRQETFGYGVVEAMAMNVKPLVVDGLSFLDFVPAPFRVKSYSPEDYIEAKKRLEGKKYPRLYKFVEEYDYKKVLPKMLKEIQ